MTKKDSREMIKIHDAVFVNPFNVISVNLGKSNVYVSMTNNRSHRYVPADPRSLPADFARIVKALKERTDCVDIRHDIVIVSDAICSVAMIEIGVAVNLINGHVEYIRCLPEERQALINRISKEVAQAA